MSTKLKIAQRALLENRTLVVEDHQVTFIEAVGLTTTTRWSYAQIDAVYVSVGNDLCLQSGQKMVQLKYNPKQAADQQAVAFLLERLRALGAPAVSPPPAQ